MLAKTHVATSDLRSGLWLLVSWYGFNVTQHATAYCSCALHARMAFLIM